ncbi:TetR/AcrR family transcriptional regulator [Aquisediminimonas profunda]|uniref:TetR/AcrR family transcriptional regulator n=1 Tax=Aquisediminimonas profunda TaxID=1550733 RepID=UPI001C63A0B8|nr:TetR/AcrR family transcriptional regulator [Aquisediminimonas profunda]
MVKNTKPERRRYSPEKRRSLILDHTADIVAREGVAQLSVERIGKEAGISKSLVYAYFPNLTELLRELYQREMRHIRRAQADAANGAATFEDLVRSITHAYLSYMHERGPLIERLAAEPSVSEMRDPTEFSRNKAVDYLAEIITHHFDLPPDIARAATDISFGLPASAGSYLHRGNLDLKTVEDLTVTMIIGTIIHLKDEYSVRRQPLRRQD